MRQLRALALRLRTLFGGSAAGSDFADEIESHIQMQIDDNLRAGMSPAEARRLALARFGGVEAVKERYRDRQTIPAFETLVADLRYGGRMMRRNPGFTFVAVLSLALGIGATAAIFSVIDAVVLRSLPVPRADEVRVVMNQTHLGAFSRFSYPTFERLRDAFPRPGGLAAMSRVMRSRARIDGRGEPETTNAQLVSSEYFGVLDLRPAAGRLPGESDAGLPVAVISHAFMQRRFGGGGDPLGRSLIVNGQHLTIIGVAPEGFDGVWLETPVDVWMPVALQHAVKYMQSYRATNSAADKPWLDQEGLAWLELILRADRADGPELAALRPVFHQLVLKEAETISDPHERKLVLARQQLTLEPFTRGFSNLRQRFATPLLALMAMVSLLLLIACANTANLLLARASARQREMAVRLSMGASRGRVVQQLLTESVLLGVAAGAVGLAIAPWASDLLVRMTMGLTTGLVPFTIGLDGRVLAFTMLVSVFTSLIFGLAPAWRTTDLKVATALKGGGSRGVHDGSRMNLGKLLVVAQVALSLLLVVGAALFARSFRNLVGVDLGFEGQHLVSLQFSAYAAGYPVERMPATYRRLIERAEGVPGVRAAAVAMCGLMTGCRSNSDGLAIDGYQAKPGEQVMFQENRVGAGYMSTVGMRLTAGREFDARDTETSAKVVIVNETLVRRYFGSRPAIGKRVGYEAPDTEIIGIVGDARVNAAREEPVPMAFYPLAQTPRVYASTLEVRVAGDPDAMAAALRKAIAELEPELPIERVTTIADQASRGVSQERLVAALTTVLGTLALGLACLGVYGLMSYAVRRRTAELGIRMALGAPQSRVLWMVFREGLLLVVSGLAIGLPLVFLLSRLVSTMLFRVSADDPVTVVVAALALVTVAALSGYFPAWRASRVDPLVALRTE